MEREITIRPARPGDEAYLREKINEFWLDDAGFATQQFLIAERGEKRLGFCRLREHEACSEMCTLGVEEEARGQGVGARLIRGLTEKALKRHELYLVCIIPEFFVPLGFYITEHYPEPMADKLRRCETELSVPEKYVVMKYREEK